MSAVPEKDGGHFLRGMTPEYVVERRIPPQRCGPLWGGMPGRSPECLPGEGRDPPPEGLMTAGRETAPAGRTMGGLGA